MATNLLYADQAIINEKFAYGLYSSIRPRRNRYKVGWTLHPSNPLVSSCNGDSGGPLYVFDYKTGQYLLWGIVSFGTADCESGLPSCYTRVEPYSDFITNLKDAVPFRNFDIKYASKGGRSIDLEKSFNVRTEVSEANVQEIWQNYTTEDFKINLQEKAITKIPVAKDGEIEQKLPFNRCNDSNESNPHSRCNVKNLLKALLEFVACEINDTEERENISEEE